VSAQSPGDNPHRFYGTAAGVLGIFAIGLGIAELAGMPAPRIGAVMLFGSLAAYGLIAWLSRQAAADRFHVAGRGLTPFYLGLAGSADWLGAVFLVGVPALVYAQGSIGLAIVLGGGAGYVLAISLLAACLSRSRQLTVPAFLARRYESEAVRRLAAAALAIVGIGFAVAQIAALATLGTRLFGLDARLVYGVVLIAILLCALPGGAETSLRAQVVQAMVALAGFLVPVVVLSARFTGAPLPQAMYGPVVQRVELMEAGAGVPAGLATLADPWVFVGIAACVAFGIAMLPQVLSRHLALPDARIARRVAGWSLLLVALALTAAPAYAAFVKSEVLANILGQPISALPNWVATWSGNGLAAVGICDDTDVGSRLSLCAGVAGDGNGLIDAAEFRLRTEALVLITPAIADLSVVVTALAATGFVAAGLAAAGSALTAAASVLAADLARRPASVVAMRVAIVAVVAVAGGLAVALEIDGVRLALSVLALGACGLFPVLALGIWSYRFGAAAALAGMLAGFLFCLVMLVGGALGPRPGSLTFGRIALAMLGLPIGLVVHCLVGSIAAPASPTAQAFLARVRLPRRR
jgi:cation/acetate symporter